MYLPLASNVLLIAVMLWDVCTHTLDMLYQHLRVSDACCYYNRYMCMYVSVSITDIKSSTLADMYV